MRHECKCGNKNQYEFLRRYDKRWVVCLCCGHMTYLSSDLTNQTLKHFTQDEMFCSFMKIRPGANNGD
jgi:hypothetical protein